MMLIPKSARTKLVIVSVFVAFLILFVGLSVAKRKTHEATSNIPTSSSTAESTPPVPAITPSKSRLVALYGSPNTPSLGALGEQPIEASVSRIKQLAEQYKPLSAEPVVPTFEIISTIASGSPTSDNDFSRELEVTTLTPWIKAAQAAGIYVILDLQPGSDDFLTQAKMYEQLLLEPNVGLALDPEWRLAPGQVHMKQVGHVSVEEINQTSTWLADLTRDHQLSQKIFLIHQFKLAMITDRSRLDTSRPELTYTIQMDGLGAQSTKQNTWRTIRSDAPTNIVFGWKNFYDEDKPMLTPEETMHVSPQPWYVSYQ